MDELTKWVTKADRAHDRLRRAIRGGVLAPKEQINPEAVAAELEIERHPGARGAQTREQEGLVVITVVGGRTGRLPLMTPFDVSPACRKPSFNA